MKRVHGLDVPQTLEDICGRLRLALVVYDMSLPKELMGAFCKSLQRQRG
jgi:hypothetical protein